MRTAPGFVVFLEEAHSTQTLARALADLGMAAGATVVARRQTAGRGRRGRAWLSPEGALAASMILRPRCPAAEAPRLTLGAAAGLLAACDAMGVPALVKWPNDIVIPCARGPHGRLGPYRKVAGILVEVVRMTDVLECALLGVGVNLRPPRDSWPEELRTVAGSLSDQGFSRSLQWTLPLVRNAVLAGVERALHDFPMVLDTLRARSATLGRTVEVDDDGQRVRGVARALLDDGALCVADGAGAEHVVRAGDVWMAAGPPNRDAP